MRILLITFLILGLLACGKTSISVGSFGGSGGSLGSLSYSTATSYYYNQTVSDGTPVVDGVLSNFSASPALPTGMSLDSTTGVISGAPTAYSADTTYTISADSPGGLVSTDINFEVFLRIDVDHADTADDAVGADNACDDGGGNCTLRAAITHSLYEQANNSAPRTEIYVPAMTIDFSAGTTPGEINVAAIFANTQIIGDSSATTILDGGNSNRHFNFMMLNNVSFSNLQFLDGNSAAAAGGSIYVSVAALNATFDNVIFNSNTANNDGGAMSVQASSLAISNSTFTGNTSTGGVWGGGAIHYPSAVGLTVSNTTFTSNTSVNRGGAIYSPWSINVSGSTFNLNSAPYGGAINTFAIQSLEDTTFSNNSASQQGGALFVGSTGGLATIRRLYFGNNQTTGGSNQGGAIYSASANYLTIENATFDSNTAGTGGAMRAFRANLNFVTFSNNTAATADTVWSNGDINTESVIFDNAVNGTHCAGGGTFTDTGNSIEDTVASSCNLTGPQTNVDASLAVLVGATIPYFPLSSGASPAVDAGANCLSEDQMQNARPLGATCDLGAYESF